MSNRIFAGAFLLLAGTALSSMAHAEASAETSAEAGAEGAPGSFTLGEIIVTGQKLGAAPITSSAISGEAIQLFNRTSLDDAVALLPGVSAGNSGGSRNERLIFVRGFNRFQVPLTIDGIRVYLPADNRLDFGRFLTSDVAQIQVEKGYVSVLNGPDGMGGAINLVTRKPQKALEGEVRGTLGLGRDADYAGYTLSALLGTRQEKWYAQASFTRNVVDHWDLPGGFAPTAIEDGGARDLSQTVDWRLNAKIGFTPNATDEYVLSYTRQEGSKLAPLHVTDPLSAQRFWTWPEWNTDSLYFLSTTALADTVTLKTRLYRNGFYNLLRSFNDRTETTQTIGRAFNSPYWDEAWGGSAQIDIGLLPGERLSLSGQYRRDAHKEAQQSFPSGASEPVQKDVEETFSFAAENALTLSPTLTLLAGVGVDWRALRVAEEYGPPLGMPTSTPSVLYSYPLKDSEAWSAQGQLRWQASAAMDLHVSVSSRARFPTIFERFSQRFGTSIPNPDLAPERATHVELGGSLRAGPFRIEGAAFYAKVEDAIVSYATLAYPCTASTNPGPCAAQSLTQSRNLGDGDLYGAELSVEAVLSNSFSFGANYSWTHRDLTDPSNAAFRPTDVPTHKAFIHADWAPVRGLHVVPSLDIASDRWTVTTTAPVRFYRTGSYANAALRLDYELREGVQLSAGARNLFDATYQLVDGFPEAGRSFFLGLRARY